MKLKRFNPDNSRTAKPGKQTIRFAKQGQITLSKTLVERMDLKPGDKVEMVNDEESPEKRDWYVTKAKDGFSLRKYKNEHHLCFNCSSISEIMVNKFSKGKASVGFLVASEPEVIEGEQFFAILASSAY